MELKHNECMELKHNDSDVQSMYKIMQHANASFYFTTMLTFLRTHSIISQTDDLSFHKKRTDLKAADSKEHSTCKKKRKKKKHQQQTKNKKYIKSYLLLNMKPTKP